MLTTIKLYTKFLQSFSSHTSWIFQQLAGSVADMNEYFELLASYFAINSIYNTNIYMQIG